MGGECRITNILTLRRVSTPTLLLDTSSFDTSSVKEIWVNHFSKLQKTSKFAPLCAHPPRIRKRFHTQQNYDDITSNKRMHKYKLTKQCYLRFKWIIASFVRFSLFTTVKFCYIFRNKINQLTPIILIYTVHA